MWIPLKSPKLAVAVYNWKGDVRSGLPLEIGETVQILEENGVWYRGFSSKNRSSWGIFPSCVVTIRPCIVKGSGATAIAELKDDPLVREIACVLREWARLWKKLYVERETYRFSAVAKVMRELLSGRRALLAGTLTQDQTRALRLKLVAKLDWGNSGFEGDPGDDTEDYYHIQGGGDLNKSNRRAFRFWGALKTKMKMTRK